MGLSQPAVSHALARLRELFDDPLFIRRPHGLEPTRRALQLAPQIEALVQLADAALRQDNKFDPHTTNRRFELSAPDFAAAHIAPALMKQLSNAAPHAGFHIRSLGNEAAQGAVKKGEIDLAIGRFGSHYPGVILEHLYEDRYCVVVRQGHPTFRRKISLEQYMAASHILSLAPGEGGKEGDTENTANLRLLAVVPRWLLVLTLVGQSDGVGTVPRRLAERHADTLGLTILNAPFIGRKLNVSVATRAGETDEGTAWFLEQVRQSCRDG
ncbi:MAG: hypothetical protein CVT79_15575 [Alphaproteobacteria bacterium HGW-Alphaproteobacteria-18]|nr:MAG: hypothetical protein CVT79_15575 [Alphaproteobacteria bacterium HGW-Alphaproteobacteria-18]